MRLMIRFSLYLLLSFNAFAYAQTAGILLYTDTVHVNNASELVQAIRSNRVIVLEKGEYDLSVVKVLPNDYRYYSDDSGLIVSGVENMHLKGNGSVPDDVQLVTQEAYHNVLSFDKCKSIEISNLKAGHIGTQGDCLGGVFSFDFSDMIRLSKLSLYGSGAWGLSGRYVSRLTCSDSEIFDCSIGIVKMENSNRLFFNSVRFHDNTDIAYMIQLRNCIQVQFLNCDIDHNTVKEPDGWLVDLMQAYGEVYGDFVFDVADSDLIFLQNSRIVQNSVMHLAPHKTSIQLKKVKYDKTQFRSTLYQ